jgi:hypothetical protein
MTIFLPPPSLDTTGARLRFKANKGRLLEMVKDRFLFVESIPTNITDLSKVSFGSRGIRIICDLYRKGAAGHASRRNLPICLPYFPAEQGFIPRSGDMMANGDSFLPNHYIPPRLPAHECRHQG